MDNEKRGHIPFVLLHALLYIAGAVCVALLFVLKSKALGIIGLLLLFAAVPARTTPTSAWARRSILPARLRRTAALSAAFFEVVL